MDTCTVTSTIALCPELCVRNAEQSLFICEARGYDHTLYLFLGYDPSIASLNMVLLTVLGS